MKTKNKKTKKGYFGWVGKNKDLQFLLTLREKYAIQPIRL
jgi:hypothetical protein